MFDHVAPLLPAGALAALPPPLATAAFDPSLPFALTTPNLHPAAALSGTAQPVVLALAVGVGGGIAMNHAKKKPTLSDYELGLEAETPAHDAQG